MRKSKYELSLIDEAIRWQLVEDLRPKYDDEIIAYEEALNFYLFEIATSKIGKIVLNSLLGREMIWIVPNIKLDYVATTKRYPESEGGGVRIVYSPEQFRSVSAVIEKQIFYNSTEFILFHELIHASRLVRGLFNRIPLGYPYGDSEEFLATQFENLLRSTRDRSGYFSQYKGDDRLRDELYDEFARDQHLCSVLGSFLETEPLARAAADLIEPPYNPFRDYDRIVALAKAYR